jgi:hypothetical protein
MSELHGAWRNALDGIKREVTGRTVWVALDSVVPIAVEGEVAVLGVPPEQSTMLGHLRATPTKRAIQRHLSEQLGRSVAVQIISGDTLDAWEKVKEREAHVTRLQEKEYEKARTTRQKDMLWEGAYEELSRIFARVSNKGLPQRRARFLVEGVNAIVEATKEQGKLDEIGERNLARLIDRLATYAEVGSTQVGLMVLRELGEL